MSHLRHGSNAHRHGASEMNDSRAVDPFDSPDQKENGPDRAHANGTAGTPSLPRGQPSVHEQSEAREKALKAELASVQGVNKVVMSLIGSLQKSRDNMETVQKSVQSASTLLDTWTRILSQTEYNQRLILNPQWQGASQDMEDLENESMLRQQAAERRAVEDQMRREAAARHSEEQEAQKELSSTSSVRGGRGRPRGTGLRRGVSTSSTPSVTSSRGRASSRAGSGIGRGLPGARGRGRGTT